MEARTSGGSAHEANIIDGTAHPTVEINIKTLDSQVYTCQVARNVPVPDLKKQIESLTGVPAGNQRLICRGKVLKDEHILSAYEVEDGHTLHLVTRPAPQPAPPPASNGVGSEDQDSHPFTTRNRPGQVSHSVLLGTFNVPDHEDGALPEINRIFSSVLSALRMGNLMPTTVASSNGIGGTATAQPIGLQQNPIVEAQGRVEIASGRAQAGTDNQLPATEQSGSEDMPSSDTVPSLRSGFSFVGAIPAAFPQIRLVQQALVVPDALATLSQYLNRMEQVFAANGQATNHPSSIDLHSIPQARSFLFSPQTDHPQVPVRGDGDPAAWAAIIRRTHELLTNQAGSELERLADQLENEPNLHTATARGNILSAGILMQHLGALLLELGRATLTLRMGSSPADSGVNAGPSVFASDSGADPIVVQPGVGLDSMTDVPPQAAGGSGDTVNSGHMPRNINIHIRAGDVGLPSAFSIVNPQTPLSSETMQSGALLGLGENDIDGLPAFQSQGVEIPNGAGNGNVVPSVQEVPGSMPAPLSFGEQGTVRVLPMRTLVAAVPSALHTRPAIEAAGAGMGVFYPLLARIQQLSPVHFSHQLGFPQAGSGNDGHSLPPRGTLSGHQQSSFPVLHPTVRAQVQVQAWLPSGGQVGDGQADLRSGGSEGEPELPFMSLGHETPVQQQGTVAIGANVGTARQRVRSNVFENDDGNVSAACQNLDVVRSPLHAIEDSQAGAGGKHQTESQQLREPNESTGKLDAETLLQLKCSEQTRVEVEQPDCTISTGSELTQEDNVVSIPPTTAASSCGDSKEVEVKEILTGLGLDGFHPLPCRKRTHEQCVSGRMSSCVSEEPLGSLSTRLNEPATTSSGETVLQDFLSTLASQTDERTDGELVAEHHPQELSLVLEHVQNNVLFLDGHSSNMGDVMAHPVSHWLPESFPQENRGAHLGTLLPSAGLGSIMGEHMQSSVMRNVLQHIRGDAHDSENIQSQRGNGQCVADCEGMPGIRPEMPVASKGPSKSPSGNSECNWSPVQELHCRDRVNRGTLDSTIPSTCADSRKLAQIQESSGTAPNTELYQGITERPAGDSGSGIFPVIKRQKMQ